MINICVSNGETQPAYIYMNNVSFMHENELIAEFDAVLPRFQQGLNSPIVIMLENLGTNPFQSKTLSECIDLCF